MSAKWRILLLGLVAMLGSLALPNAAAAQCNGCIDCLIQFGCCGGQHTDFCGQTGEYDLLWDGGCMGSGCKSGDCDIHENDPCSRFGAAELDELIDDADWSGLGVAVAEGRASYNADLSTVYELSCTGEIIGQRVLSRAAGDLVALAMTTVRSKLLAAALASSGIRTAGALRTAG